MRQYEPSDVSKYRNLEDFFTRKHEPGSRPIDAPDHESKAVCVVDSRLVAYESVAESKKLWMKGRDFSITNLVMDTELGKEFAGGPVASLRLSPQDYHRYHSPVTDKIKLFRSIPGDYYEVEPVALQSDVDIPTRNKRQLVKSILGMCSLWLSGRPMMILLWFMRNIVNPVRRSEKVTNRASSSFRGSSIIVAFHEGKVEFDRDVVDLSKRRIQVET